MEGMDVDIDAAMAAAEEAGRLEFERVYTERIEQGLEYKAPDAEPELPAEDDPSAVAAEPPTEPDAEAEEVVEELAMDFDSVMARLRKEVAEMKVQTDEFKDRLEIARVKTQEEVAEAPAEGDEAIVPSENISLLPGSWHHAVSTDWRWLGIAPAEVWNNGDLMMKAVAQDARAMQHGSEELRSNRDLVLNAVQVRGLALQYVAEDLRGDREIVEAAVRQDRLALRYASPELRADKGIIELAMRAGDSWLRGRQALQSEAVELNSDKTAVHEAVFAMHPERWTEKIYRDWRRMEVAPQDVKSDKILVLEAIKSSWGPALQHASPELQADREIVLAAVRCDGASLQYASQDLRDDKEVVHAAAAQNWQALAYASSAARADRKIIQTHRPAFSS